MRLHRFFVEIDLAKAKRFPLTDRALVAQVTKVLRLKKGDKIILADHKRRETLATILAIGKKGIEVERADVITNENEPRTDVTLYCAVLKRENFEWVVEKATEVGAKAIVPIRTARTVKMNLNAERLQKIAREAAEQSGRGEVPEIKAIMDFKDAVEEAAVGNSRNLFFDAYMSGPFRMPAGPVKGPIGVFIGPEGGWGDEERAIVLSQGRFELASLGRLTLRAETAAIVAAFLAVQGEI
jgi:16S rRNA (uracil1498-N3)-methyltransferase